MKKTILISLIAIFSIGLIQAQVNPWSGFFTPVQKVFPNVEKAKLSNFRATSTSDSIVWLFRPVMNLTALAVSFNNGTAVTQPLSAVGTGVSYAKFIPVNGQPYAQYSINALLLTNVNLSGSQLSGLGGAVTFGVFNNFISAGVGYLNNKVLALVNIGVSF